jgi:hypothetical protein
LAGKPPPLPPRPPSTPQPVLPDWVLRPRIFVVDGESITVVEIGDLARALDRKPVTIRLWIRRGVLPDAAIRQDRWHPRISRRQWLLKEAECIRAVAAANGLLDSKRLNPAKTRFPVEVRRALGLRNHHCRSRD